MCAYARVGVEQQMSPGKGESSNSAVPEGLAGRSSDWGRAVGCHRPHLDTPLGVQMPSRGPGTYHGDPWIPAFGVSAAHLRQAALLPWGSRQGLEWGGESEGGWAGGQPEGHRSLGGEVQPRWWNGGLPEAERHTAQSIRTSE